MEPQIRYAQTADGVGIAYWTMGEGVPLVYASNVMGDVQWYTHNEETRKQVHTLVAAGCRVVRYDMRGMGSSARDVTDLSLSARVLDLEAVVDHAGIDRFALCGYVHGSTVAIAYAARHRERVSHLVLINPYASGPAYYEKVPTARAMLDLSGMAEQDWEFFTLTVASAAGGFSDPAQALRVAALFRSSLSPAVYVSFAREAQRIDVQGLLAGLAVPTLVAVDRAGIGHEDLTKAIASRVAGARLVTTDDYARDVITFLGLNVMLPPVAPPPVTAAASGTAIVLFADIADSTALTERMGDAAFRAKARELDTLLRTIIVELGGTPIDGKLLGDGVLATFPAASQGIAAALACGSAGEDRGLPLHLGLHAGDVIREENNVFGGAVNIAARISGLSAPGEVLVSRTVADLARTSAGVAFEDRGEHALKGVGDAVRVYAVRAGGA